MFPKVLPITLFVRDCYRAVAVALFVRYAKLMVGGVQQSGEIVFSSEKFVEEVNQIDL